MKNGPYFIWLFVLSYVLFRIIDLIFETTETAVIFLLSLIFIHLILDKNQWIIKKLDEKTKRKDKLK